MFAAVTEEAGRLLVAGHAAMSRHDPDGAVRVVAAWSSTGVAVPVGIRVGVGGRVPQDFDAISGTEAEVEAKCPMLMMGADAVWEWTGADAPGFGDPLTRDACEVAADVASGALPADAAERVHGVVLAGAVPPAAPPARVPAGVPLRILAAELAVLERDGRPEAFVTVTGRAVLVPASGNYKEGCAVLERPPRMVAPEFATREGRAGYQTRYREYLCPVTGLRVDSEIISEGDAASHDILIDALGTAAPAAPRG